MRVFPFVLLLLVAGPGCLDALTGRDLVRPQDYLSDGTYTRWIIEIDHSPGQRPSDAWLDTLHSRLTQVAAKDSITIQIDDELPSQATWSDSDIAALERKYKDQETGGNTVVTWVAYLDGRYTNDLVLGVAYNWDRIAIFSERINQGCRLDTLCVGNAGTVQTAVLVHEFGHIIGLVDRGVDMVTPHTDGSKHSNNPNSVMNAKVESTGIFGISNIPTRFDCNDRADLAAVSGRGAC